MWRGGGGGGGGAQLAALAAAACTRRRRSAGGAGGGGVNEESALAATTTAVMEVAENEVAVKVGWLKGSMPSARLDGEEAVSAAQRHLAAVVAPLTPLGTS